MFKYEYEGNVFYGKYNNEFILRQCMEEKLNIPRGTLKRGSPCSNHIDSKKNIILTRLDLVKYTNKGVRIYVDKIEEVRVKIKRLLKEDYFLIFDYIDPRGALRKSSVRPEEVRYYSEMLRDIELRNHNTGYYVANSYPTKDYNEVTEQFNKIAVSIARKIQRLGIANQMYNKYITLEEALNSRCIQNNNRYAKINEQVQK